jgi:endonuclease III
MAAAKRLRSIVEALLPRYEADGKKIELTDLTDPFQLGTWFILGQRAKRNGQARAYDALRRAKGLTPGQLLEIPEDKLLSIAQIAGPYEDARAKELYAFADRIEELCGQDFKKAFKTERGARKFLENEMQKPREFIDFLLLYGGGFTVFPLDASVFRVAVRLGFGKLKTEKTPDAKAYAALQKLLEAEVANDPKFMIRAHSALHRHGIDTCHAAFPACDQCPLTAECVYLKKHPLPPKAAAPAWPSRAL